MPAVALKRRTTSDRAVRSLTALPPGLYLWDALAAALADQGAPDPGASLDAALATGALTLVGVTVRDSDGAPCNDRLVRVAAHPARHQAAPGLRVSPLPTETVGVSLGRR